MTYYYQILNKENINIFEKRNNNEESIVFSCSKSQNKIFEGEHIYHYMFDYIPDEFKNCNSILILSNILNPISKEQKVQYIGPLLQFTFLLPENEYIMNYYSQVDNDKVVNPVLETNNRCYLLNKQLYIEKESLKDEFTQDFLLNAYQKIFKNSSYYKYLKIFRKQIIT